MTAVHPRRGGDNAESAVLEELPQLRYVSDTEAEHYDAELVEPLSAEAVRMVGACLLETGTKVEIKSAIVVLATGKKGRFYLRRPQHQRLVDEDAWYLFTVCEPRPARRVLAMKFVPATDVDELVPSWRNGGSGRAKYAQVAWSRVFDSERLEVSR